MAKFIEIDLSEFVINDNIADDFPLECTCVCCLSQNTRFINLKTCKHKTFLEVFFKDMFPVTDLLICTICHRMLKLIHGFITKVEKSTLALNNKVSSGNEGVTFRDCDVNYKPKLSITKCQTLADIKVEDDIDRSVVDIKRRAKDCNYEASTVSIFNVEPNATCTEARIPATASMTQPNILNLDTAIKSSSFDDYDLITEIKIEPDSEVDPGPSDVKPRRNTSGVKKKKTKNHKKSKVKTPIEKHEGKIRTVTLSEEDLSTERELLRSEEKYQKLPYKCDLCVVGFATETIYQGHIQKHHNKNKNGFSCDICDSVLNSIPILREHRRRHLRRFECQICLKRYHDSYSAVQHYNDCHGDVDSIAVAYNCRECNFNTNSYRSYRYHRSKHNKPTCDLCGNIFVTNSSLKIHMLTKHKPTPVTYNCELCAKVYKSKSGLHSHNSSAHGGGAQYHTCRTHYRSHRALMHHLKTHSAHRDTSEYKFECADCEGKFANKQSLRSHIEWEHLLMRHHRCVKCDKVFRSSASLKKHDSYVHEKKRPPRDKICDYCGEAFTIKLPNASVCCLCHSLLRKFQNFKNQTLRSFKILTEQVPVRNGTLRLQKTSIQTINIENTESKICKAENEDEIITENNVSQEFSTNPLKDDLFDEDGDFDRNYIDGENFKERAIKIVEMKIEDGCDVYRENNTESKNKANSDSVVLDNEAVDAVGVRTPNELDKMEEQLSSSSEESSCGSDDSIFDTRLKPKTLSRGPPAQSSRLSAAKTTNRIPPPPPSRSPASKLTSRVPPAQPSSSSTSKRGLCESDGSPVIPCKRFRPKFGHVPSTRDKSAQPRLSPDPHTHRSISMRAPRQLEFEGTSNFEFNYEIDCRAIMPPIVQDYGDMPDIPDSILFNPSTPSVSLLRSDVVTPNFSSERDAASPSILSFRRSECSSPDLPDDNNDVPLLDISPSRRGATSTWSIDPGCMKKIDFTKEQELLVPPPTDPYEAFRLIIDNELLDLIVRETNLNAARVASSENVKQTSRIKSWKDVTRDELLTFIGLLLHTGTIRLNRISDYWKRHHLFNAPCFGQFMSRNRFLLILRCLHFSSESSEEDRLIKIRPFMDHFNNKMNTIYSPGKELSLDESMVLWRGRLLFRQYIKNKRHKYGVKLYVLAEPDGIVLKFQVYAGSNDETSGPGHCSKIVFKLLEERLDCGHHVYMDNYYNSYGLAVKLLDRQTYCTGTLRRNRRDNPVEIGSVSLEKGENKSLFLNGVHVGRWRDKRYVLYISTEHDNEMMETTSKRGSVALKPKAIVHYNNVMSGVDLQDQMLAYYPVQRKTLRWYKKLFVHVLQMSLTNSLHLYNKFSPNDKLNLYDFRLKILEKLLPNPNDVNRRNVLKMKHELTKIEKVRVRTKKVGNITKETTEVARKECKGCKAQKKRVQTIYECKQCENSPGFCTKCFCLAHS
ncbi:uncharacterized protein LOC101741752 isoform X5 [Bombyx mori]|uniref:uncharacterized protein LOC101741752 isoform X5 n=1 Tax=Bombyx mori TaxID=7091 RepID=UPI002ED26C84